jgi:dTDP-glucose 4,6-dehydratase
LSATKAKAVLPLFEEDLEHILEHTKGLWEQVRGKSLFVTGGTGFFGMWLVESFLHINRRLSLDASICLLTRDMEGYKQKAPHLAADPSLSMVLGDVRSFAFPEGKTYEYMIHAGTTSSSPVPPLEMFSTIVDGTRRVLDFARKCGTKKFLFVSSGAVYGPQPEEMTHISEDYLGGPVTTSPSSAYGEGKRAAELLCAMHSTTELECKIARCFAFVGPHLPIDAHFAIGNFIRDAINGREILVKGDGSAIRSYQYAADLAIYLWTILFTGECNRAYNVGSEESTSIRTLADSVINSLQSEANVVLERVLDSKHNANRYVPSTSRISNELGVTNQTSLSESIQKAARWWKRQLG